LTLNYVRQRDLNNIVDPKSVIKTPHLEEIENMADVNISDHVKSGADTVKHETQTAIGIWQHNAARMMRANERIIHGFMAAAKLQIDVGQEVLRHRMDRLQTTKPDTAPHTIIEAQTQDFQRIIGTMREVSEELRVTFSDAAKLLFEGSDDDLKTAQHAMEDFADRSADFVKKGQDVAASVTSKTAHKAAAKADEAQAKYHEDV